MFKFKSKYVYMNIKEFYPEREDTQINCEEFETKYENNILKIRCYHGLVYLIKGLTDDEAMYLGTFIDSEIHEGNNFILPKLNDKMQVNWIHGKRTYSTYEE